MFDKLIIFSSFMAIQILWWNSTIDVSEIFYMSFFILPLLLLIYFYSKESCQSIKLLMIMIFINLIMFNIWLIYISIFGITFALINVSFIVTLYVLGLTHHVFGDKCQCKLLKNKTNCVVVILFIAILLNILFDYVLKNYVHL